MNASLGHALLRMRKGEVRRLTGGRGRGIAVFEGLVWVTVDGDSRDTILAAGESHDFDRDGAVVVQAFAPSALLPYGDPRQGVPTPTPARAVPHISAYELTRLARQARDAAIARTAVRAAGAVVSVAQRARDALRRMQARPSTGAAGETTSPWKAAGHGACA